VIARVSLAQDNFIRSGVEKLVSRRAHNPKAAGSSPAPATLQLHTAPV
jgi:hypothetical protein